MKIISILVTTIFLLSACENAREFPEVKNVTLLKETDFVATLENPINKNKNNIYSASLLFAWDEIKEAVDSEIAVSKKAEDLYLLHKSQTYKEVLKEWEYAASAEIVGDRMTAKASFSKSLPFAEKLISYTDRLAFENTKVASFGASGHHYFQHNIVEVLYYKNDKNFLVRLNPKDEEHQILLLMSSKKHKNMGEYYAEIAKRTEKGKADRGHKNRCWRSTFMDDDQLIIPKFSYNLSKDYETMIGKEVKTTNVSCTIDQMWQRTAFILDEVGAEIESEAAVEVNEEASEEKPTPQKLIFDKPFALFLARKDAINPYFGMWVANAELMVKE